MLLKTKNIKTYKVGGYFLCWRGGTLLSQRKQPPSDAILFQSPFVKTLRTSFLVDAWCYAFHHKLSAHLYYLLLFYHPLFLLGWVLYSLLRICRSVIIGLPLLPSRHKTTPSYISSDIMLGILLGLFRTCYIILGNWLCCSGYSQCYHCLFSCFKMS